MMAAAAAVSEQCFNLVTKTFCRTACRGRLYTGLPTATDGRTDQKVPTRERERVGEPLKGLPAFSLFFLGRKEMLDGSEERKKQT